MKRQVKDLFELGRLQAGDDTNVVFYNPEDDSLWLGREVGFPFQLFLPSSATIYGVYLLGRKLSLSGYFPLVLSAVTIAVLTWLMFLIRSRKEIDLVRFQATEAFFKHQEKYRKSMPLVNCLLRISVILVTVAYLKFSGFVLFFMTVALFHANLLLLGVKQGKRNKILKQLKLKYEKEAAERKG